MPAGRPKNIKSPEILWKHFEDYKKDCKENQKRKENFFSPKQDKEISITRERPLSWEGFECWLFDNGIVANIERYKANKDGAYEEFRNILRAIDRKIFEDQYSGASVGIYQQNIVARRLGLVDKREDTGNKYKDAGKIEVTIVKPKDE